ncbi:hypothetical protein GALMADRAFT_241716 [Galerina marginata CBS 339.88]|uniref:Uncharacterized protein n=1 Tax=Galerina marginata (strain CBS 339.88) TaxID=685588 RepID=A0A067TDB6_GALM3|nr:hypothetical protein GALMADRAFT_241716 [Galerina marginata CBS 339.88]
MGNPEILGRFADAVAAVPRTLSIKDDQSPFSKIPTPHCRQPPPHAHISAMRFPTVIAPFLIALSTTVFLVSAGPIEYGICQTACNDGAVACYRGAGATFGTVVTDADTPAAILACNAGLGACSAACPAVALPGPTS